MEKSAIVEFFGSAYALAARIGIARSTVSRWGRWVPRKYHERIADAIRDEQRKRAETREVMRGIS